MSGFGTGGFGSSQPNQFGGGGFGQAPPPQQPQGFGFGGPPAQQQTPNPPSGFGAPAAPFGSAPPAAPFGGGASAPFGASAGGAPAAPFGNNAASTFGAPAAPANPMNNNPFGTPPPANQQQAPIAFGTAPAAPFGQAPAAAVSTPAPFGQQPPAFGQPSAAAPTNSNPFGAAPVPSFPGPSSSNAPAVNNTNPFGGPSAPATTGSNVSNVPNPFGGNAAAPVASVPMMSFGVSSNVAGDSNMMASSDPPSNFPNNNNNNALFSPGLPQPDMEGAADDNRNKKKPLKNLPFGTPVSGGSGNNDTTNAAPAWPGAANNAAAPPTNNPFGAAPTGSAFPAPAAFPGPGTVASGNNDGATSPTPDHSNDADTQQSDKLAKLKARLEEKKKRLEERKRKEQLQQQQQQQPNEQGNLSPTRKEAQRNNALDPNAPSFSPAGGGGGATNTTSNMDKNAAEASLADRNALRFATGAANQMTRSLLPQDLQNETATDYSALRQTHTDAQDLGSAKSLVGTCPHMCPDEELLRREREGDIQLLEIVKPGELHPAGWTLRDTCVKRFRRSAADYKLDVPEWIRPPHILERVCSYLEEWVMERDRQGPDVRFSGGTAAPPSLDVYQFIWDRTRMVRKDFILQNYVGTSGSCDARAVRCHERIARWHAMAEHQLSHIEDFCVMQSQQNIQELGQTMKTLNQYYDDALGRSTVEIPDENGNETAAKNDSPESMSHGCMSNVIQGANPVDFDNTPLKNSSDAGNVAARAIGKPNQHGTAEPEMSGLYILLTIDNDGGMEVMRYVAHLSRARPHIYRSRPVQLALSIYKTKKESNYARFFQILRAPSTPYLFACIMFKHVELMRKVALQVMSKTYGGKSKDTNEAIYDAYPLRSLVRLLCFEDDEEALAACNHYGIKVRETKVRYSTGSKVEQIIFWRQGAFKEPRDEDKGTSIPLRPWKMVKTIESKLDGATRLAVCRGEKSGEGAFFTGSPAAAVTAMVSPAQTMEQDAKRLEEMRRAEDGRRAAEEKQRALQMAEQKKREEQAERIRAKELEIERKKQEQLRKAKEEQEREMKRLAEEKEAARLKAEQEEQRRQQQLEEMKRQEEAKKKAEEERKRREQIERERLEAERKKQEEILRKKKEQERLEAERRRVEAEKKRRLEEERQRLAREAEARRIAEERLKRERERRAEEERKVALEWSIRVNAAKKKLSFRRWMNKFPTHLRLLDETNNQLMNLGRKSHGIKLMTTPTPSTPPLKRTFGLRNLMESLLRKGQPSDIRPAAAFSKIFNDSVHVEREQIATPLLLKISVVLPDSEDSGVLGLFSLIQTWIGRALHFRKVDQAVSFTGEIRVVVADGNEKGVLDSSDAVIVVVPFVNEQSLEESIVSLENIVRNDIPRVALVLVDDIENGVDEISQQIESRLSDSSNELFTVTNNDASEESICDCLSVSLECLAREVVDGSPKNLERASIDDLCTKCITSAIYAGEYDRRDELMEAAQNVLSWLVDDLDNMLPFDDMKWQLWPAFEFAQSASVGVPDYFGKGADLPLNWMELSNRASVERKVHRWIERMNGNFPQVLGRLLSGAPNDVVEECRLLAENRSYRRSLQTALLWKSQDFDPWQNELYVYLPRGSFNELTRRIGARAASAVPSLQQGAELEYVTRQKSIEARTLTVPSLGNEAEGGLDFSPKRPRDGPESGADEEPPAPIDSAMIDRVASKRQRLSPAKQETQMSMELAESAAFTKHLQDLLSGNVIQDQMVGSRSLSSFLRGAPKPQVPHTDAEARID